MGARIDLTAAGSCRGASYPVDGSDGDFAHISCSAPLEGRSPASETSTIMIQTVFENLYALVGSLLVSSHSAYKQKSHPSWSPGMPVLDPSPI